MSRPAKKEKSRFSQRLIALREACDLTQHQLAEAMGVDRGIVCYWECVARNPRFHTLEQLADFFHVTPGYFLDEHPESQPVDKPDLRTLFRQIRKLTPDQQNRVQEFVTVLKEQSVIAE